MEAVRNGHSKQGIALRILAAGLVALVAIFVRDAFDESSASGTDGSRVVDYTIDSELLGRELPVKVVVPPGARDGRRSLLVFLHGRGEDEKSYLVEPMFEALRKQGGRAPIVAFPEGGPDSYWHDRDDGEWGSYVLDEVIPEIAERFEIEPERIAIGGISMGGFGALDLAAIDPERFCAVGAHSPAVWESAGDTASGAFDNEDDFERHDVFDELGPPDDPLDGKRVWLDVGDEDPFADTVADLRDLLTEGGANVRLHEGDGGHESAYWSSNWNRYMQFYARALKKCQVDSPAVHKHEGKKDDGNGGRKDGQTPGQDAPASEPQGGKTPADQ
jgi:S-formylglutathione hydrolase FrmB